MSRTGKKSNWVRRLILSIAGVFLGLIILVAVGVFILNSQWFLTFVEDKLTEFIGRGVRIESIDIDLGQTINVRVEEVSVDNPSWASAQFLASMEVLEVSVDLFELLGGNLVFTDTQAKEPIIHLEQSTQGRPNWTIGNGAGSSHDEQTSGSQREDEEESASNLPRIESLSVDDGHLTYEDPTTDTSIQLSFKSRDGKGSTGKNRMIADGGGSIFGQSLTIDFSAGPPSELTEKDANGYPLELRLNSPETLLLVAGRVDALVSPETANLQIRLEGQHLSWWREALNMELPALPDYQLTGHVKLAEGVWSFHPVNLTVGNSDLAGTLRIIPEAQPLRIEGDLSSERLDVPQLQGYMPDQQDSDPLTVQAARSLAFLANPELQATLKYRADRIVTGEWPIRDVEMRLTLEEKTLTLETLSGTATGTHLNAEGRVSVEEDLAEGRIQFGLEADQLREKATAADARSSETMESSELPGNLTGELAVKATLNRGSAEEQKALPGSGDRPADRVEFESVAIKKFRLQYADPTSNTNIVARLEEGISEPEMIIEAQGEYHNTPLELSLTLPGLNSLVDTSNDAKSVQQLSAALKIAGATASVTGTMKPVWPPTHIDLRFLAKSEAPATTAGVLGIDFPPLGKVALKGSLSKRNSTWNINELKGRFGKSHIQGSATIKTADEVRFKAVLDSKLLDVAALVPTLGADKDQPEPATSGPQSSKSSSSETFSADISIPSWLTNLHGKVSIDVQRLVLANARLKDVSVDAAIDDGRLRIAPLSIVLGGGAVKATAHLNLAAPSLAGSLQTDIQRVGLDEAMETFGRDAAELGKVSGGIALRLPAANQNTEDPLSTDALLERIRIENVRLRYDDPALQAKTDLRLTADSLASGAKITGTVEYQDNPVDVSISTGSLRQALQDSKSMPVDATFQINKTTIDVQGSVGTLFPLEKFNGKVRVDGPDPARLGEALGIPLPHLPPYRLDAQLHREQGSEGKQTFNFNNLDGIIGDSDVAGTLRVTTGGERPMMLLHLRSDKLDFDDLAPLIGAPPDPEETASEKQEAQAEVSGDRETLLPAKPMDFTQLRQMDANVEYRAKRVQAPKLPLDDFLLDMILEDGHLQINRLDFGVAGGTMAMELEVNAQESPVQAKLITHFDQVNLSELLARFEVAEDSFGNIGGRATLWMRGKSMAEWFGTADGGMYLTMIGGKIDAMLIELAGLDFTESAAVFLSTDTAVNIDCAYTDLQARSGIVTIQPFLVDTKDTKFKGYGKMNLRQEQMDLTVKPYPQDFSLLSSRGPLHITGTFTNPNFSVDPSFPLPEFGTADTSVRCEGMIDALRTARKNNMNRE